MGKPYKCLRIPRLNVSIDVSPTRTFSQPQEDTIESDRECKHRGTGGGGDVFFSFGVPPFLSWSREHWSKLQMSRVTFSNMNLRYSWRYLINSRFFVRILIVMRGARNPEGPLRHGASTNVRQSFDSLKGQE